MPLDAGLILDPAEDSPLAARELSADTGFHSKTSWRRMSEDCEVPRLFAKTRRFSSFPTSISLGLRLVEV
jgi:predicted DNA-binding transcriptional regulator AlpA